MSPDWYLGSYDVSNPQSFDRYSYVENMPLSFIDVSGLEKWWLTGDGYYCHSWVDENGNAYVECMYIGGGQQINPTNNVNSGGGIRRAWEYEKRAVKCNLAAEMSIANQDGVALLLDATSMAVPGEGTVGGLAQWGISSASLINTAVSYNNSGNAKFGLSTSIAGMNTGLFTVAAYGAGWKSAEAIPVIGQGVSAFALINDLVTAAPHGWSTYWTCMGGK